MAWRKTRATPTKTGTHQTHQEKFLSLLMRAGDDECWKINVGRTVDPLEKYCIFSFKHPTSDTAHTYIARKVSYEVFIGEIEEGKVLITTCGKQGCVNPKHLEVVARSQLKANRGKI